MFAELRMKEYVTKENIQRETVEKEDVVRIRWAKNWEWYINKLREREKEIMDYKNYNPKALGLCLTEKEDPRSLLPFPITTSRNYGWLVQRPEFALEIFGPYYNNSRKLRSPSEMSIPPPSSGPVFECDPLNRPTYFKLRKYV